MIVTEKKKNRATQAVILALFVIMVGSIIYYITGYQTVPANKKSITNSNSTDSLKNVKDKSLASIKNTITVTNNEPIKEKRIAQPETWKPKENNKQKNLIENQPKFDKLDSIIGKYRFLHTYRNAIEGKPAVLKSLYSIKIECIAKMGEIMQKIKEKLDDSTKIVFEKKYIRQYVLDYKSADSLTEKYINKNTEKKSIQEIEY